MYTCKSQQKEKITQRNLRQSWKKCVCFACILVHITYKNGDVHVLEICCDSGSTGEFISFSGKWYTRTPIQFKEVSDMHNFFACPIDLLPM